MSIDSGYPKILITTTGSYDRIWVLDACRDHERNFWVAGGIRPSGTSYAVHWVGKFDSDWNRIKEWIGTTAWSDASWESPQTEHRMVGGITIRSNDEVFIGLSAKHTGDSLRHFWAAKLTNLTGTTWSLFKEVSDDHGAPYSNNPYTIVDMACVANAQDDVCYYWRCSGYESVAAATAIVGFRIYKANDTWTDTGSLESDEKGYGCISAGVLPHPTVSGRFWTAGFYGGTGGNQDQKWHTFDTPAGTTISFTSKYNQVGSNTTFADGPPRNFVLDSIGANRHTFGEDLGDSNKFKVNKDGSGDYYPSVRITYPVMASLNQAGYAKFVGYDLPTVSGWSAYQKLMSSAYNAGYDGEDTFSLTLNTLACPVVKIFPVNDSKYYSFPLEGHLFLFSQNTASIWGVAFDGLSWEGEPTPSATAWINFSGTEMVVGGYLFHHLHPSIAAELDNTVHLSWQTTAS